MHAVICSMEQKNRTKNLTVTVKSVCMEKSGIENTPFVFHRQNNYIQIGTKWGE